MKRKLFLALALALLVQSGAMADNRPNLELEELPAAGAPLDTDPELPQAAIQPEPPDDWRGSGIRIEKTGEGRAVYVINNQTVIVPPLDPLPTKDKSWPAGIAFMKGAIRNQDSHLRMLDLMYEKSEGIGARADYQNDQMTVILQNQGNDRGVANAARKKLNEYELLDNEREARMTELENLLKSKGGKAQRSH